MENQAETGVYRDLEGSGAVCCLSAQNEEGLGNDCSGSRLFE